MKIGIIGLGKMGSAIAYRAANAGYTIIGYDPTITANEHAQHEHVRLVDTIAAVAEDARVVWLMVPAGATVDSVLNELMPHLQPGDILVDGGNSHYTDSMQRAQKLSASGIDFLDCGTSGGLQGRDIGYSLMIGGNREAYARIEPLFKALAAPDGYGYVGPSGAGHYVKMIHNGIEYALLQAYAEGFQLLKQGSFAQEHLDLEEISRIWNHGAIIRSWILELAQAILARDQEFAAISGSIAESGTGQWTVQEAHERNIPVPVIEKSLAIRSWSRETGGNYATKLVALLRHEFGGHAVKKVE